VRAIQNGDIVWSDDFYKDGDAGRPLLVVGTVEMDAHGMQYVCVALTSRTYHERSIEIQEQDYEDAPLPLESHALPWVFQTLSREHLRRYKTCITDEKLDAIIEAASHYIGATA